MGKRDFQQLCKESGSINGLDAEISLSTFYNLDSDNTSLCNSELGNCLKITFGQSPALESLLMCIVQNQISSYRVQSCKRMKTHC